jgi:hypothetical protein
LPFMHAGQPILAVRGRWADPRVAGNTGVTQGMHVRAILFDPCAYLISSADGPVTRDEDIDIARHALEQPQRGEVVLNRVSGVVQVEHRNQDIRKHVAGDENPAFLDQQRRMAGSMRLMLDDPDLRAIPRNLRSFGGQAGNEAEQIERDLLGDVRRYQRGDAGLRTRVRQPNSDSGRAAGRAVTRRRAEPGVPEQVIPMRMRRKPCHNGLAQLAKVVREAGHFVALHPGVDEQHASPAAHDNGVALAELALVDQHILRDMSQHGCKANVPGRLGPHLKQLADEAVYWRVDWSRHDLGSAAEVVRRGHAERHPELTSEAVEALVWEFSYDTGDRSPEACPRDVPELPSAANNRSQPHPVNLKETRALNGVKVSRGCVCFETALRAAFSASEPSAKPTDAAALAVVNATL